MQVSNLHRATKQEPSRDGRGACFSARRRSRLICMILLKLNGSIPLEDKLHIILRDFIAAAVFPLVRLLTSIPPVT